MSELRSAVDGLRSEDLAALPDARIEEDFAEVQRAWELLGAERLRRLPELERRMPYRRDGYLSPVPWLADRFRMTWGHACQEVRLARALEEMPETRRAFEDGEISMSVARVLVKTREADPDAFRESEPQLVEAARIHSTGDLQRIAGYWRQAAERAASFSGEDKLRERRRLHASVTFLGMVRVDGDLDPETGETLLTALRAVMDVEARAAGEVDGQTPGQRRSDALAEICRQFLDRTDRPSVAGERPHVTVTVGADALRDPRDALRRVLEAGDGGTDTAEPSPMGLERIVPSELDHVGPVDPELARKISCDSSVMRVVTAGRSEPLDIGRRTPVVPPAIRRAVIVRDRHCRFPGCDRPHSHCDAHHIIHWADGGPTALANLLLLCRRHHGMVHERGRFGFALGLEDGRPVFRRPDGSALDERAPP
jgi:hypothetical protein